VLPEQARRPDFEFVELAAELSVAGSAEAELGSVDLLDIPLAPARSSACAWWTISVSRSTRWWSSRSPVASNA
jgi:hypothetical protein